jgi:hypothetical protein
MGARGGGNWLLSTTLCASGGNDYHDGYDHENEAVKRSEGVGAGEVH